jgi:hypothetical protein
MNARHFSIFLAGLGIGAAGAALLAPKAGRELRRDARERVAGDLQKVQGRIREAKLAVNREVQRIDAAVHAGVETYRKANGVGAMA